MFLHQALPKDSGHTHKTPYSIKKKESPHNTPKVDTANLSSFHKAEIQPHSYAYARSHSLKSTEKPSRSSSVHKRFLQPKQSHFIEGPDDTSRAQLTKATGKKANNVDGCAISHEAQGQSFRGIENSPFLLCKVENKAVKSNSRPLQWNDFTKVDEAQYFCYEGQTKGDRVRHGFGTQWFSNGEKFVGFFQDGKAWGQGTFYGLKKKVMGIWEDNFLRQVLIEI